MPFKSLPFALAAVVVLPTLLAWIVSFAMFKRRVGGVYFAIITQAVALICTVLIIGQQGYTGGVNGMTDLKTLWGWDTRTDSAKVILYYVCVALLVAAIVLCRYIQTSKLGTLLLACATRKTACASRATTWPTSRSSPSAWRRRSRASAARCSRCRWASCRRVSWGIVPSIEMVMLSVCLGDNDERIIVE